MRRGFVSFFLILLALNTGWFVVYSASLGWRGLTEADPSEVSRVFFRDAPVATVALALHMLAGALTTVLPRVSAMTCSTSPVQVPQDALALVVARMSSSVVAPPAMACVMVPLHTPLQPQISASGGNAATAAIGSTGAPP